MARLTAWLLPIRLAPAMAVLVLLAGLPAPAPHGQVTEQEITEESPLSRPFLERETVRLVLVPVTVTDRKGRPILDLRQADFQLLVDGLPQPIEVFEPPLDDVKPAVAPGTLDLEVADSSGRDTGATDTELSAAGAEGSTGSGSAVAGAGPARGAPATGGTAAASAIHETLPATKSYVALVFDRYMTTYRGVARAFDALDGFIEEGGSPLQEFGLFAFIHGNLKTLQPFTSEIRLLQTALAAAWEDARQFDNWLTMEPERQIDVAAGADPCGRIKTRSMIQAQRGRNVLLGLEDLARAMAELRGRKSVVLLTDGIRMRAGLNYAYALNSPRSFKGYALEHCTTLLTAEYKRMTRTFMTANITLSPVSMMGLMAAGPGDRNAIDELLDSSKFMAEETGGRVPLGLNDFQGEMMEAVEQPLRSYVLGFRATESAPGSAHAIEVRVNRQRVRVFARSEYVELSDTFEIDSRFSAALLFPGRDRELQGEASLFTLPVTSKRRELHVLVSLPGEALAWLTAAGGRRQADLQISGLLRDDKGRADELLRSAYTVRAGSLGPPSRLMVQPTVVTDVKRPSELILMALDQVSGLATSWSMPVAGPETGKDPLLVSAPILLAPAGDSQVVSPGGDPGLSRRLHDQLYLPVADTHAVPGDDPGEERGAGSERILVMSRIVNLPEGGSARFCLDDGRCIAAELREEVALENTPVMKPLEEIEQGGDAPVGSASTEGPPDEIDGGGERSTAVGKAAAGGDGSDREEEPEAGSAGNQSSLWSAWVKIPARALASGGIRVEVVSAEGALLAVKAGKEPSPDRPTP